MNLIRLLAFSSVLLLALSTAAQQTTTSPATGPDMHPPTMAPVAQHLKMLSDQLGLSVDQQAQARPILQQMHDGSQKLEDDPNLTSEQRHAAMHSLFMKADQQMRVFLTDAQKKTLDEMEARMHQEHPGSPDGTPAPAPQN
jgi:Spy/CpxP family protein refolding chaperone